MNRWMIGATAVVLAASAAPAFAWAPKPAPLKKLFPYLQAYLNLPAEQRSRFTLSYRLEISGAPQAALKAWYVQAGARTPIPMGSDGRVMRLPTAAMLAAGEDALLDAPKGASMRVRMQLEPTARPAAELDARELAASVTQAAAGARKAAGVMGFAVPRMQAVVFKGVSSGQVVSSGGRAADLPLLKGQPMYEPAKWPGAQTVRFGRVPTEMMIGPAN